MAACGGLEHIFEKPLSENSTFLESLSPWNQIKSMKSIDASSFTELFGDLHFKEAHVESLSSSSSSSMNDDSNQEIDIPNEDSSFCPSKQYRHSDSFSSMNSESLSICTEGLGFESFEDVEDLLRSDYYGNDWNKHQEQRRNSTGNVTLTENGHRSHWIHECRRSRINRRELPPPISCIGSNGKPWVCFKSFRQDGRFILKEIRIPTQEFLHACRENGRLRMRFVHSDDEIIEDDEEDLEGRGGDLLNKVEEGTNGE